MPGGTAAFPKVIIRQHIEFCEQNVGDAPPLRIKRLGAEGLLQ